MIPTSTLLFELLRVSVNTQNHLSRTPSRQEWQLIYTQAEKHTILGVMFSGIERLPKDYMPHRELLLKWYASAAFVEINYELLEKRTREVSETFFRDGIRSCILKGQSIAKLYPNPKRRSGGDIDIWVEGKRKDVLNYLRSKWVLGDVLMYHADVKVFDDVVVEVHYVPAFSYNPRRYVKYKKFFRESRKAEFQLLNPDLGYGVPSLYFNGVYSLIHIFNHALNNEVRLKQIIDYYYILQSLCSKDRQRIIQQIEGMGLKRFAGGLMFVIQQLFYTSVTSNLLLCPIDEKAGKLLMDDLFRNEYERRIKVLIRHLWLYPSEVLWAPFWKVWHWCWRKFNR